MHKEAREVSPMLEDGKTIGKELGGGSNVSISMASKSRCRMMLAGLRTHLLLLLVLLGVIIGFGLGFALRTVNMTEAAYIWLALPGDLFMRALQSIILPLIIASIISGTASLDPKTNGRVTSLSLIYIVAVNTFGVIVGVAVYHIVDPAGSVTSDLLASESGPAKKYLTTTDIFTDTIRNLVPDNLVSMCFQKDQTSYMEAKVVVENRTEVEYVRNTGKAASTNVLGIIVVCMLLGMATSKVGKDGLPFIKFFESSTTVILTVMRWVIWLTPVGVLSLIATSIAKATDLEKMFTSFGLFITTVIIAVLIIHGVFPILVLIVFRRNPLTFLYQSLRSLLAGFAPPSSAMAIPEMLNLIESQPNIDVRISRFCVLFFSATCRVGSASFVLITSLFLSHLEGIEFPISQLITLLILSVAATSAIPSVPSGSIVCVLIILSSLGVETSNIGIVMALDWLHDRVRTTANVQGTIFGTFLINKLANGHHLHDEQVDV